jgi:Ca-activated chloride channel family protein
MILQSPWALVLLVLLPLVWWRWLSRRTRTSVRYSSVAWLKRHGSGMRVKARQLIPTLRTLAMAILILCLARPQKGNEQTRIFSEGIAIQMVVDRSSSMQAEDFTDGRRRINRLEAVKTVFRDFVAGDGELEGRGDDLIGMIAFAGYADSVSPMTLDHDFLLETLEDTEIVERQSEDGTAIGEAVALAVERLRDLGRRKQEDESRRIKSKIVILLTDGENNKGEIDPAQAAEIAKTFGIKVYTIGAGSTGVSQGGFFAPRYPPVDEATLKQIADATGGRYWRATDTESLRAIYEEIDKLEKSATEEKRYELWSELATERVQLGSIRVPPPLAIALALLAFEVILSNTILRKVP